MKLSNMICGLGKASKCNDGVVTVIYMDSICTDRYIADMIDK
jgi:hypothetical protein